MGLVVQIEHWPMPAAIALATEGVRANYNQGCGGGGFGAADREIGSKLDGAKVLTAIDEISKNARHLSDWCLFAYSSPGWNSTRLTERLVENVAYDWVFSRYEQYNEIVQIRTYNKITPLIPLIAAGVALEQASGAEINKVNGELVYSPVATKIQLIQMLVSGDAKEANDDSLSFKKKRTIYYQKHWSRILVHVDTIKMILMRYDKIAQKRFKEELAKEMGAN
ncbi:hypothetical protein EXA18_06320 [Vibrio cincinnatiensis]|uniref:hypothetical protein n=1 Tax=Vibrio cincinnatiensis TaxID=675 RepID=UPI001EDE9ED8|nr:hypothetical protein [Vibrio cincinnatiensis]MCG3743103.1 hypothetical protein [Vibrio cincinnatiensis]